jgi:ferric-dicitrate binding protein FerR (iron transport regulator)
VDSGDRYSRIAGDWMQRVWRDAPARVPMIPRGLIGAVERELRSRRRRRVARRWTVRTLVSSAGLAAVVAVVVALRSWSADEARQRAPDDEALVLLPSETEVAAATPGAARIEAGARLSAPASAPVRIGSVDGTELTIEPGGSLTVVDASASKRFALLRGEVGIHVRKLRAGERFVVDAEDVEIEVHGTTFRVAILADAPPCARSIRTHVSVTEGVVTVNAAGHQARLLPGDEWPPACTAGNAPASPAGSDDRDDVAPRAPTRKRGWTMPDDHRQQRAASDTARGRAAPTSIAGSALGKPSPLEPQNDLFASAVAAKQRGQTADALELFDRFVERYPDSSLIESAVVQQMRLSAKIDPRAGASAARKYLARFPDGVARDEARLLAGVPPAP